MPKVEKKGERQDRVKAIASSSGYQCYFRPDDMTFNAKRREFAQQISHLRELEMNGEISSFQSSQQIKALWKQIERWEEILEGLRVAVAA